MGTPVLSAPGSEEVGPRAGRSPQEISAKATLAVTVCANRGVWAGARVRGLSRRDGIGGPEIPFAPQATGRNARRSSDARELEAWRKMSSRLSRPPCPVEASMVKIYGASSDSAKGRYSPAECTGIVKTPIEGKPDPAHISTSFIERQNLTMRMHMRRFTRLTNALSKKVENHAYAVALHMMYYNFVKLHSKLRVTPAMAAGVADRLWEVADIVALIETEETKLPRKRGRYKKTT
jgi:hypothetical protein